MAASNRSRALAAIALLALAGSCGQGDSPPGGGAFTVRFAGPDTVEVVAGGDSASTTIEIARAGYTGLVQFGLGAALPGGVSCMFIPAATEGAASSVAVLAEAGTVAATVSIPIEAVGGGAIHELTLAVRVIDPLQGDFSLVPPAALTLVPGSHADAPVAIARAGFGGPLAVAVDPPALPGLAADVLWPDRPGRGDRFAVRVTAARSASPGEITLTVKAKGGALERTVALQVIVEAPGGGGNDFFLSVSPDVLSAAAGTQVAVAVSIGRDGFTDPVELSLAGVPAAVAAQFAPAVAGGTSSTLTLTIAPSAEPGTWELSIDGTGGGKTRSAALSLTVEPPMTASFRIAALTVAQGARAHDAIDIDYASIVGPVALAITAPAGVTTTLEAASTEESSVGLVVAVAPDAPPGTGNAVLTVTGGGQTATALLAVTVKAPAPVLVIDADGSAGNLLAPDPQPSAEDAAFAAALEAVLGAGGWDVHVVPAGGAQQADGPFAAELGQYPKVIWYGSDPTANDRAAIEAWLGAAGRRFIQVAPFPAILAAGDWTQILDPFAAIMGVRGTAGAINGAGTSAIEATGQGAFASLGTFTIAAGNPGDLVTAMNPAAGAEALVLTSIPDPGGGSGTVQAALVVRKAQPAGGTFLTATLPLQRVGGGEPGSKAQLVDALLNR